MRFIFSLNLFETNDAIQCTLALDTTVVRKAATVQLLEREVDRGEARFLDGCRGWGRSSGLDGCGDGGRFRNDGRRTKWRRHHVQVVHDDFNGAVRVGPLPFVMSEDEDDEAVMKIVESVETMSCVKMSPFSRNSEIRGGNARLFVLVQMLKIGFVAATHTRTRIVV